MKSNNPLITKTRSRKRLQLTFPDDGRTQQSFKDETNINNIVAKFAKTGLVEHVNDVQGAYGDFTNVADYQLHLNQVMAAQDAFDRLPSGIRARFNNQPTVLLEFINDRRNDEEAIKLGLRQAPPPPEPKGPPGPSGGSGATDLPPEAPKAP